MKFVGSSKLIRSFAQLGTLALVSALGAGCGQSASFGLAPEDESFSQKIVYNNKVDVLWVVDNSVTMKQYQDRLAAQFSSFVDALVATKLDFRIAVTSTDVGGGGHKGQFIGSTKVLTAGTPNLKNAFAANVQIGEEGSNVERGLEAMKLALSPENLQTTNAGFLREDAFLVVVVLSDEEDQSSGSAGDYIEFLNQLKPNFTSTQKGWIAHFIGELELNGPCKVNNTAASPGYRYMELVTASQGINETICRPDLVKALTNVRARITEILTEYRLERKPAFGSIQVVINGKLLAEDAENGWTYHQDGNVIRFHGTGVPPADATVNVFYQPTEIKN